MMSGQALTLHVVKKYFSFIVSGHKTVEGRIAKEKFINLNKGDRLKFVSNDKEIDATIVETARFSTFREMLKHYGVKNCLPDIGNIDDGVSVYHSFPSYQSGESVQGVIGIKIKID